jgi:hypothetical protein
LIREQPWYRRDAFIHGMNAAGMQVYCEQPKQPDKETLLLIWNRYAHWHEAAIRVERAGGRVLVAENGYLGTGGVSPKFEVHPSGPKPGSYYALSEGWHNGRGKSPEGGPERFKALGVRLKPWREKGEHILICPNRSFGVGEQVMPPDWAERCLARLRGSSGRPVRVRHHPGNDAPKRPLSEDLKGAWAVVIWSSSCGVHALLEGIPVFCEAPYWILKGAAAGGTVDTPSLPDRLPHFERMAHAQWTLSEIQTGEPFRRLL